MEILNIARKHTPPTPTILMTSYADITTAVEAIKRGAADYISKPFRSEELLMVMQQAIDKPEAKESAEVTSDTAQSSKSPSETKEYDNEAEVVRSEERRVGKERR